jgi:UrcA family protein
MMTCHPRLTAVVAALAAGMWFSSIAQADTDMNAIVVSAGVLTTETVGHSAIGAPMERVTLTHHVSYADLDLESHAGVLALEQRVKDVARLACDQLDKLYPFEEKSAPECIADAVAQASGQVEQAIAAAQRKPESE